jgi:hypothetical protein
MGLLNKPFSGSNKNSTFDTLPPCKSEQELLERYGAISLEKQISFGDLIGDRSWNVDVSNGTISFGQDFSFPMQIIGTISHAAQSWLWAWANAQSNLPDSIIKDSLFLKKYGEENDIPLLSNRSFDFTKEELHLMGIIASGLTNASGYYLCDYGQGTMVVTVNSPQIVEATKDDHLRMLTVFPQLISQFEMNHLSAFRNYLAAKSYSITENGNSVSGTRDGKTITGEFDELFRLTNIKS